MTLRLQTWRAHLVVWMLSRSLRPTVRECREFMSKTLSGWHR
jgi:hypothetical protein